MRSTRVCVLDIPQFHHSEHAQHMCVCLTFHIFIIIDSSEHAQMMCVRVCVRARPRALDIPDFHRC